MDTPKANVYIVEDEAIIADELAYLLQSQGYQITGKSNSGEDALIKINENAPDLILMDIHLRGKLNGIETAEKINSINNIPVIFITAYPEEVTNTPTYLNHPYACLNKPFKENDLFCQVNASILQKDNLKKLCNHSHWMQTILQSMKTGLVMLSPNNDVEYINKTAEIMLNQSKETLIGSQSDALFKKLTLTTQQASHLENFTTHYTKPFTLKFTGFYQEKEPGSIQLSTKPYFDNNGNFAGNLIELHDIHHSENKITELKDELDQIHLAKEMQEENAANLANIIETLNNENLQLKDIIQFHELSFNSQLNTISNKINEMNKGAKPEAIISKGKERNNFKQIKSIQELIHSYLKFYQTEFLPAESDIKNTLTYTLIEDLKNIIFRDLNKYFRAVFYYELNLPIIIQCDQIKIKKFFFYLVKLLLESSDIYDVMLYVKKKRKYKNQYRLLFQLTIRGNKNEIEKIPEVYNKAIPLNKINKNNNFDEHYLVHIVQMLIKLLDAKFSIEYPSSLHWEPDSSLTINLSIPYDLPFENELEYIAEENKHRPIEEHFKQKESYKILYIGPNDFQNQQIKKIFKHIGCKYSNIESHKEILKHIVSNKIAYDFLIFDLKQAQQLESECGQGLFNELKNQSNIILLIDATKHLELSMLQKKFKAHAVIEKPISPFELLMTIKNIANGNDTDEKPKTEVKKYSSITQSENNTKSTSENSIKHEKILLADTNETNVKIIEAFLRIQGWNIITVTNKKTLMHEIKHQKFSLIMIGFALAHDEDFMSLGIIKKTIQKSGHDTPIILIRDEEQSIFESIILQTNINGILTKPIKSENLYTIIKENINPDVVYDLPKLDKMTLLNSAYGDLEILKEIAKFFTDSIPDGITHLAQLIEQKNWKELSENAHKWKGGVAQFGAIHAAKLLKELELASNSKDINQVKDILILIKAEIKKLNHFFSTPGWEKTL